MFIGGWKYGGDLHTRRDLLEEAFKNGEPMGGDLLSKPADAKVLRFVVWTTKDSHSANLQRIKGWAEGSQTYLTLDEPICADGL